MAATEARVGHVQLLQHNKQLQCLLAQLKQKTEIYEVGLGSISKILKDVPQELQFKALTSADKLRSSFSLTTHLISQKKALDRIEKVVYEVHNTVAFKGIFAGLFAPLNKEQAIAQRNGSQMNTSHSVVNIPQSSQSQSKDTQSKQPHSNQFHLNQMQTSNSQASLIISTTRASDPVTTTVNKTPLPVSTLSIQKSVIKTMPPAPPPPMITKHTVSPAVIHRVPEEQKEIQIQIEANPIEKHPAFLEQEMFFRRAHNFQKFGMDLDILRRKRGRPPTKIPGYSTTLNHQRKHSHVGTSRFEDDYMRRPEAIEATEEDMAWKCLERVYESHHVPLKEKYFPTDNLGSFNISQILENAPILLSNVETARDNIQEHDFESRSTSVSPLRKDT